MGYMLWPLAVTSLSSTRGGRRASRWTLIHARQATILGLGGSLLVLAVLALPLIVVVAGGGLSPRATIAVYGVGFAVDLIVVGVLTATSIRASLRAGRGELFTIPVVTRLMQRLFR